MEASKRIQQEVKKIADFELYEKNPLDERDFMLHNDAF